MWLTVDRNADGVLLVYDITSHASFRALPHWLGESRRHLAPHAVTALVGNKTDMRHLRAVTQTEAAEFAETERLKFIETSAADSTNVEFAFQSIVREMYSAAKLREESSYLVDNNEAENKRQHTINLNFENTKKPKKRCCTS